MTKAKKNMYQIQYHDNTYRMVDWTKAEYKEVGEAMENEKNVVIFDEGIFRVDFIRAVVFIPEPEPITKEEENKLTEYGGFDPEIIEWIKEQGIDPVKGGSAE